MGSVPKAYPKPILFSHKEQEKQEVYLVARRLLSLVANIILEAVPRQAISLKIAVDALERLRATTEARRI